MLGERAAAEPGCLAAELEDRVAAAQDVLETPWEEVGMDVSVRDAPPHREVEVPPLEPFPVDP